MDQTILLHPAKKAGKLDPADRFHAILPLRFIGNKGVLCQYVFKHDVLRALNRRPIMASLLFKLLMFLEPFFSQLCPVDTAAEHHSQNVVIIRIIHPNHPEHHPSVGPVLDDLDAFHIRSCIPCAIKLKQPFPLEHRGKTLPEIRTNMLFYI